MVSHVLNTFFSLYVLSKGKDFFTQKPIGYEGAEVEARKLVQSIFRTAVAAGMVYAISAAVRCTPERYYTVMTAGCAAALLLSYPISRVLKGSCLMGAGYLILKEGAFRVLLAGVRTLFSEKRAPGAGEALLGAVKVYFSLIFGFSLINLGCAENSADRKKERFIVDQGVVTLVKKVAAAVLFLFRY